MQLLKDLLKIQSPSGNELKMRDFLIDYFQKHENLFKTKPVLHYGAEFQNCLAVSFGVPRVAIFAHIDTVAYMTRYKKELIEIGSPTAKNGDILVGKEFGDEFEKLIEVKFIKQKKEDEAAYSYEYDRILHRGTELCYKPNFKEKDGVIQSPYLDNRIGIYCALKAAETLENGMLVFTCWEEHQGGSAAHMARFVHDEFGIKKALISDVTWISDGINLGDGTVISLRDDAIPRRDYVLEIIQIAKKYNLPYQLEVEDSGGSDGNEIQNVPYSIDWCFVGIPCDKMHSSKEKILKSDLETTILLYEKLMQEI
ncbi:MAG: M20/M25/M40 family metallo-hydrolase [Sphingobacteriales bacterium]|nr:MAG: M20/M25/M40 family metallo-hydrolase [Sphingobacteriales bacterium]